ncbi:hypothetical protein L198_07465 [Cryptococcus wingfieldii CBS 7118]|uniref:Uncharacterized protein n=1 Tax=Cryptococcus wingfieldii CBS 7118 TaxID=1295528 RepID=A0A1E3IBD4_9TREE|nr:hypothetical protein L198_07465 [Cryptococcus wingfieldii CBS 7118]ODN85897.1 hypothetical protein L198_07465 [Cryptococcus wingfieldii CBS 7118]
MSAYNDTSNTSPYDTPIQHNEEPHHEPVTIEEIRELLDSLSYSSSECSRDGYFPPADTRRPNPYQPQDEDEYQSDTGLEPYTENERIRTVASQAADSAMIHLDHLPYDERACMAREWAIAQMTQQGYTVLFSAETGVVDADLGERREEVPDDDATSVDSSDPYRLYNLDDGDDDNERYHSIIDDD